MKSTEEGTEKSEEASFSLLDWRAPNLLPTLTIRGSPSMQHQADKPLHSLHNYSLHNYRLDSSLR
jgi:hypothetical protein